MHRNSSRFAEVRQGRVKQLQELYTRNSCKRSSGRAPPQVPKRNPETRLSSGSSESQDLDLSQFQYDDGNQGNYPLTHQTSQDYSPQHSYHGHPVDVHGYNNHHNGDHGHYGLPVGGAAPAPSPLQGGGLPPPLPPGRGSVTSMPGYVAPGQYPLGENGLGSVSPPPPPPGFDMGATMTSPASQPEELYEKRLPTRMEELPARLLQQHSLGSSQSGGSEFDYYGMQLPVPIDNGYPLPHELYDTTLPTPHPAPQSDLRRSSSSSSSSQSHKSSPYTGSKETIMPPEYYTGGGTLPMQMVPHMMSPPHLIHNHHQHHEVSPDNDFPPPPPPQFFPSVPSAPSSMPGSPQRPPPPTLPKPNKPAPGGNGNFNRPPTNGVPPPPPPLSSIPCNAYNNHHQAAPQSFAAPPPPPPPLGGMQKFNQQDSADLSAQFQACNLRSTMQPPPEDRPGKSPLVNVHTDLISQIQEGVPLRKSSAGKKIRGTDELPVNDSGDTFSETASVTSSGSGEDCSSSGSRAPPPTYPKPNANKPSPIHTNTMPSGSSVPNHSNNSSITSDDVDVTQIDGFTPIPEGCPEWKRAMLERKNQQLLESARKQKAEKDRETEKWKGVPEWKKALIMEREKKKDDEQNPQEEEMRRRRDEELKIQNMPEWKRALYMKKKGDM